MKIALIILHADPTRGGAERYTQDLAASLAARNHHVTILATTHPPDTAPGIQTQKIPAPGRTRLARYRAFLNSLDAHVACAPYDVIHAMLPVHRCDLYHPHAGLAAEAIATGSRLSRWGNRLNRRRHHMATVERDLLESQNPPLVLCLSNYVKSSVKRWYPQLPDDRLIRLFNGTDLHRFDPAARPSAGTELRARLALPDTAVIALMLAQDFARKGLDTAIRAVAAVNDPRLLLLVAGRDDPSAYRRLAASLGIEKQVHFAGQTTDPYAFYQAADLFVLPTRHDPCSLVVLEALSMGVPVITTKFNGASEAMESGRHGIVLDNPTNVSALADALRTLLDPGLRAAQAAACLHLRSSLSQQAHLHALEDIYLGLSSRAP